MAFLIRLYIILTPFTTWLALSGWLRLPVVCILLAFVAGVLALIVNIYKRPLSVFTDLEDALLIPGSISFVLLSFLTGSLNSKSFNHTLSFIFVFVLYLLFFKFVVRATVRQNIFDEIARLAALSVFICSSIVLFEWFTANFTHLIIRKWFVLSAVTSNMIFYSQGFFKSVAGVSEEPSLMAYNLNVLFGLGLCYVQKLSPVKWLVYVIMFALALICTASAGGIGFMIIGVMLATLTLQRLVRYVVGAGIFIGLIWLIHESNFEASLLIDKLIDKVTFQDMSARMRINAWAIGYENWSENPWLGKSPGYGNEHGLRYFDNFMGYQSVYFKLLAETGIFATLFFVSFQGVILFKTYYLPEPFRTPLLISVIAGFGHWFIADAYYHPAIWVTVAAIQILWAGLAQRKKQTAEPEHIV